MCNMSGKNLIEHCREIGQWFSFSAFQCDHYGEIGSYCRKNPSEFGLFSYSHVIMSQDIFVFNILSAVPYRKIILSAVHSAANFEIWAHLILGEYTEKQGKVFWSPCQIFPKF